MLLPQVVLQEGSGPDRMAVDGGPWVGVDDLGDQRIDNTEGRGRASFSGGIVQAGQEVLVGSLPKTGDPVVNGLPSNEEAVGDLLDGIALIEPHQGLCPDEFFGGQGSGGEVSEGCRSRGRR